jgi:hypothetical protein
MRVALLGALGALACSGARVGGPDAPTLTLPARFAEGSGEDVDAGSVDAGPPAAPAPALLTHGGLPDPEPLRLARQWEYRVVYANGKPSVVNVRPRVFVRPVVTSRQMGRYAIELWIGSELVDRVRFDFPLLGAEEPPRGKRRPLNEPPSFASGAHVERLLLVPASPRATRAVLVDRATGSVTPLPWPPDAPLDSASAQADAGTPSGSREFLDASR